MRMPSSGYDSGTGQRKESLRIDAARVPRAERDKEFAAARKASGLERARLLHAGLEAVAPWLGSLKDHGDDPLLAFYPAIVAEIRQMDSADGRLIAVYNARQKTRDEWIATNDSTFGKLKEFDGEEGLQRGHSIHRRRLEAAYHRRAPLAIRVRSTGLSRVGRPIHGRPQKLAAAVWPQQTERQSSGNPSSIASRTICSIRTASRKGWPNTIGGSMIRKPPPQSGCGCFV